MGEKTMGFGHDDSWIWIIIVVFFFLIVFDHH